MHMDVNAAVWRAQGAQVSGSFHVKKRKSERGLRKNTGNVCYKCGCDIICSLIIGYLLEGEK
jgi:hypothetical protein